MIGLIVLVAIWIATIAKLCFSVSWFVPFHPELSALYFTPATILTSITALASTAYYFSQAFGVQRRIGTRARLAEEFVHVNGLRTLGREELRAYARERRRLRRGGFRTKHDDLRPKGQRVLAQLKQYEARRGHLARKVVAPLSKKELMWFYMPHASTILGVLLTILPIALFIDAPYVPLVSLDGSYPVDLEDGAIRSFPIMSMRALGWLTTLPPIIYIITRWMAKAGMIAAQAKDRQTLEELQERLTITSRGDLSLPSYDVLRDEAEIICRIKARQAEHPSLPGIDDPVLTVAAD